MEINLLQIGAAFFQILLVWVFSWIVIGIFTIGTRKAVKTKEKKFTSKLIKGN